MDDSRATMWMFGGLASGNTDGSTAACIQTTQQELCTGDKWMDELWQYKVPTNEWKLIQFGNSSSSLSHPTARHGAVACGKPGDFMVVFGGYGSVNETLSDTWIFNMSDERWHRINTCNGNGDFAGESPESRADMLHWCTSDSLWIVGGIGSKGNLLNDMWRFSFSNRCWTSSNNATINFHKLISNSPTHGMPLLAAPQPDSPTWLLSDTELFFMSNVTTSSTSGNLGTESTVAEGQRCEMWSLSTTDNVPEWKTFPLTPEKHKTSVSHENTFVKFRGDTPACRTSATSWVDDETDNMWLFGGHRHIPRYVNRTSVFVCDVWVLEANNATWVQWLQKRYSKMQKYLFRTKAPRLNTPTSRAHAVSWYYNGTLYMFGGEAMNDDGTIKYLNDLWSWHLGHPTLSPHKLLLPPTGVFFVTLGALCFLALCVFGIIFVAKASSPQAPRLKPPSVRNGKIKYSPVSTTEDVLFEQL